MAVHAQLERLALAKGFTFEEHKVSVAPQPAEKTVEVMKKPGY